MPTATSIRIAQEPAARPARCLACAWGATQGKLGFTTGAAQRPRDRTVPARHLEALREASRSAQQRVGLPEEARGISGSEAGRAGCWRHRW